MNFALIGDDSEILPLVSAIAGRPTNPEPPRLNHPDHGPLRNGTGATITDNKNPSLRSSINDIMAKIEVNSTIMMSAPG